MHSAALPDFAFRECGYANVVRAKVVWRSERFADEANLVPLSPGWDIMLKLHRESRDKRWNVEAYATNLLKRNVEDLIGVNLNARF